MRMAFTKDGSQLVVLVAPGECTAGGADAQITIRDAATLEPIGRSDRAGRLRRRVRRFLLCDRPRFRAHARRPLRSSPRPSDGELGVVGSPEPQDDADGGDRDGLACARRSARTVAPRRSASSDGIQLVDMRTGAVRTATGGLAGSPNWLLFSPDGKTVVSTSLDGTVTLWDVGSATLRETLRGHSNSVQQPVFSPDGETLYTVSHDGTAIAWDLSGDRGLGRPFTFTHDRRFSTTGYDGHPGEFSPDGRLIAVGLKEQGHRALGRARARRRSAAPLLETGGEVKALAFSPDGRTLAAVTRRRHRSRSGTSIRDRCCQGPLARGPARLERRASAATGRYSPRASSDGGVRLWDVATGAALGEIGAGGDCGRRRLQPDGALVAFAPMSHRGRRRRSGTWPSARWSPACDGGDADVLRYRRLQPRRPDARGRWLRHESCASGTSAPGSSSTSSTRAARARLTLEFSPDGRTLAVSGFEPVASLWDVATGAQIGPRLTAGSRRAMIDLSPDGRRLLRPTATAKGLSGTSTPSRGRSAPARSRTAR